MRTLQTILFKQVLSRLRVRKCEKMLIHHPFWAFSAELVPNFYVKKDVKNRYKYVNGGFISRACSHGLIQHFPLIARVHLWSNVNKMLTEKKIYAAKVTFGCGGSQNTDSLEHR